MKKLRTFVEEILRDKRIDEEELLRVCDYIAEDDVLDLQDVELLVQLYTGANSYSPEFEELFFGALKSVLLEDGRIVGYERFLLMQMLYSGRTLRKVEIEFLEDLRREAFEVSPEFDQLIAAARDAFRRGHDVGGRPN